MALQLERILGINLPSLVGQSAAPMTTGVASILPTDATLSAASLNTGSHCIAIHPDPSTPIIAYAAGATLVLYNHRKNKQIGFLCAATQSPAQQDVSTKSSTTSASWASGLRKTASQSNLSGNSSIKSISCVQFSPDGSVVAVGESGHQPRILIWDYSTMTLSVELTGHKFGVHALAFSPNSKYIVSVGFQVGFYDFIHGEHDGNLFVWEWKRGQKVACSRMSVKIQSLAFDPSGQYFVTAGLRHVKFWSFDSHAKKSALTSGPMQLMEGRYGIVGEHKQCHFMTVVCSPAAHPTTYAITENGLLVLFGEGRVMEKWVELKVKSGICMDANTKMVVCGGSDGIVRLFESDTLKYISTLPRPHALGVDVASQTRQHPDLVYPDVMAVKLDKSGDKVMCCYSDHSIFIWDIKDPKVVGKHRSFLYHSDCVWGVEEMYPNIEGTSSSLAQNTFLSYSSDGTVRFWNLVSSSSPLSPTSPASGLSKYSGRNVYSRDLLKIVYADMQGLLKAKVGEQVKSDALDRTGVRAVAVSQDGHYMAMGDRIGNIRIYNVNTFEQVYFLEAHEAEILSLSFSNSSRDDSILLASSSRDRLVHVFNVSKGFELIQTLDDHSSSITGVKFAINGQKIVSCAADKSVIFRSFNTSSTEFITYHHAVGRSTVYDMDVEVSQKYVACVAQDRRLNIYSIATGKQVRSYKPDPVEEYGISDAGGFIKVAMDPSGLLAATASTDKFIRIFDFYSGACMARVVGHAELITSIKFTQDGTRLISTSADGCIFVWKLAPLLVETIHNHLNELKLGKPRIDLTTSKSNRPLIKQGWAHAEASAPPVTTDTADTTSTLEVASRQAVAPSSSSDIPLEPAEEDSAFIFSYSESGLPFWARRKLGKEKQAEPVSSPPQLSPTSRERAKPPLPEPWAERMGADVTKGIVLFAEQEASLEEQPIAKFDPFGRRYSVELSSPEKVVVSEISQEEKEPIQQDQDEGSCEDVVETIPMEKEISRENSFHVSTQSPDVGTWAESDALQDTPNASSLEEKEESNVKPPETHFQEYINEPIDYSPNLDVRKSLSARHLLSKNKDVAQETLQQEEEREKQEEQQELEEEEEVENIPEPAHILDKTLVFDTLPSIVSEDISSGLSSPLPLLSEVSESIDKPVQETQDELDAKAMLDIMTQLQAITHSSIQSLTNYSASETFEKQKVVQEKLYIILKDVHQTTFTALNKLNVSSSDGIIKTSALEEMIEDGSLKNILQVYSNMLIDRLKEKK